MVQQQHHTDSIRQPGAELIQGLVIDTPMIPCGYSEGVSVTGVPPYEEQTCVSYVDQQTVNRCREEVIFGPGLAPTAYRSSIICYLDSTRRKYIDRVDYETKLMPKEFTETYFLRPKHTMKTYVTLFDYNSNKKRRWYKAAVDMKPKTYTSTHSFSTDHTGSNINSDHKQDDITNMEHRVTNGTGVSRREINGWNAETNTNGSSLDIRVYSNGQEVPNNMSGRCATEINNNMADSSPDYAYRSGPFVYVPETERNGDITMNGVVGEGGSESDSTDEDIIR